MSKGNTTILVIDDDPDVLFATSRILKNAGYFVLEGRSGKDAIEMAQFHNPDLILLDAILPDIHGIDVLLKLKENKHTQHTPIILISSQKIGSEDQSRGLEFGADQYIARPIPNRELLARVQAFLRLKKTEQELKNIAIILKSWSINEPGNYRSKSRTKKRLSVCWNSRKKPYQLTMILRLFFLLQTRIWSIQTLPIYC